MKFMEKFNDLAERYLLPLANKVSAQRHLNAIKDGMAVAVAASIIGGFSLIISTPPFKPEQLGNGFFSRMLLTWYDWAQANSYAIKLPYFASMALMGLFICIGIAYHLAKHYEIDPLGASIVSLVVFIIVAAPVTSVVAMDSIQEGMNIAELSDLSMQAIPTNFLDATGIFTAILISIGCVEIMNFLFKNDIRIKMPEGVPPAIASSFDSIIPMIVCLGIFYPISLLVQNLSGGELLPAVIMNLLAPAMSGLDSLIGICIITFIAQLFWFFGLHGASITQFVRLPFMNTYIAANASAFEAGKPLVHFFTQPFWSYFIAIGGGGSTLALVILMLRSKSKQFKELGKIAIIPGIFNINEPVIFGVPLVLNPILGIPFIFVPVINAIIGYTAMYFGLVNKGFAETPWTTPAPLGAALGLADFRGAILVIFLIIVDIIIYYPFFKTSEKMKLAEEQE